MVPALPAPVGRDGAAEATAATCTASCPPSAALLRGDPPEGPAPCLLRVYRRDYRDYRPDYREAAAAPPVPTRPQPRPRRPLTASRGRSSTRGAGREGGGAAEAAPPSPGPMDPPGRHHPAGRDWARPGATTARRGGAGPAPPPPPPSPPQPFPGLRHGGGEGGQIIFICACKYMSILQTSSIDSLKH